MLHPTLSEEYLPDDSKSKGLLSASRSSNSLLKTTESKKSINQTPSKLMYSRYKEFAKMPQYSLDAVSFLFYVLISLLASNKKLLTLPWFRRRTNAEERS